MSQVIESPKNEFSYSSMPTAARPQSVSSSPFVFNVDFAVFAGHVLEDMEDKVDAELIVSRRTEESKDLDTALKELGIQ